MPNNVMNRVVFNGTKDEIAKIFAFIKGENGAIDFNSIIPQPVGIEETSASYPVHEDVWMWKLRYGYPSWYEWNCDKWGTKWNAYEINTDGASDNFIEFETAWSAPFPIIERLAECFPNVGIRHLWADEDTGSNCGIREYIGKITTFENIPDSCTKEAYEIAFDLRPYLWDEYELVDGNYRYKNED